MSSVARVERRAPCHVRERDERPSFEILSRRAVIAAGALKPVGDTLSYRNIYSWRQTLLGALLR